MVESNPQQNTPMSAESVGPPGQGQPKKQAQVSPSSDSSGGKPPQPPNGGNDPDDLVRNLKETLKKEQGEIQEDQTALDSRKKNADKLQADIALLEKSAKEFAEELEYEKKYQEIKDEQEKTQLAYDDAKRDAETASDAEQAEVNKVINDDIDKKIKALDDTVTTLEAGEDNTESVAYAQAQQKKAEREQKNAEDAFEKEKKLVSRIKDSFSKFNELKKLEDEQYDKKNKKKMYFYFVELKKYYDQANKWVVTKETYRSNWESKWDTLRKKKEALRSADQQLNFRKATLEVKKKELETAKKSRTTDILDKLS